MLLSFRKRFMGSAIKREMQTSKSFAMSGSGWLWPFYLGAIELLRDSGKLTANSMCAGTSGGSLGSLVACSGMSTHTALELVIDMSENPKFKHDIDKGLKISLDTILPQDVAEICNGKLHVVTTKLWPNPSMSPIISSSFSHREELIETVAASCFIPFYSSRRMSTKIGLETHVDGGLLAFMPPIGDIRLCPFPKKYIIPSLGPSPDISLRSSDYPLYKLLRWSLRPPERAVLKDLYRKGAEATERWLERNEIA